MTLLLLLPEIGRAWTYDNASAFTQTSDPTSGTHSSGSLTNGIAFVSIGWATTSATIVSVTYGGQTCTLAANDASGSRPVAIYYLLNPPTGSQTVTVDFSASPSRAVVEVQTWSGANSTQNQSGKTCGTSATSNDPTCTLTTASGELVIDSMALSFTSGVTFSADSPSTERITVGSGATFGGTASFEATGTSATMSWTISSSRAWGICAASFQPASGAAAPTRRRVGIGKRR